MDDPISAFLTHDWASLGGWGLFVSMAMFIVIGSIREWWVPGKRYRRMEEAALKSAKALEEALTQNGQLITSNEITKHFFQETAPKRGDS